MTENAILLIGASALLLTCLVSYWHDHLRLRNIRRETALRRLRRIARGGQGDTPTDRAYVAHRGAGAVRRASEESS